MPRRHTGFEHGVMRVIGQGDQRGRAPNDAIPTVGQDGAKSGVAILSHLLAVRHEGLRRIEFGMQGTVPTERRLGIFPLIVRFSVPAGALSALEARLDAAAADHTVPLGEDPTGLGVNAGTLIDMKLAAGIGRAVHRKSGAGLGQDTPEGEGQQGS